MTYKDATVAQLAEFETVIDVRSPAEFADDHLPGAINCPVLDNDERAQVGTLYKQVSPFAARRLGAVLVARNIARQIELHFSEKPKSWRPLIYCWRGGQRSGAVTHIFREIGWNAQRLDGGYKSWRRQVLAALTVLPEQFSFRLLAGPTGSGKSRILEAIAAQGGQVLHLEELAAHKGSVLGALPDAPQPSQKSFESSLYLALAGLDPARPVFAEAESRRIGKLALPNELHAVLATASCLRVEASMAARVAFLLRDYAYFLDDFPQLAARLQRLSDLQGRETVTNWLTLAETGQFPQLVEDLLEKHYDPHYRRSQLRHFKDYDAAPLFATDDLAPQAIERLAKAILAT